MKAITAGKLPNLPADSVCTAGQIAPNRIYRTSANFKLLNQQKDFGQLRDIDWNFSGFGKLWTYNLNYFEFLRHPTLTDDEGLQLILAWIKKAETHRDGWEPYPTSLRIVHWLQFHRERQLQLPELTEQSLQRQYNDLWRKREFHLDGNHLLENAIALHCGALYFGVAKEISRSNSFLLNQLKEQFLADGAHYELSPMYHCILTWRLLDLYGYEKSLNPASTATSSAISSTLEKALGWLQAITDNQGNYPHFNDSTDGIAPTPKALFHYARQLGLNTEEIALGASGYRHWKTERCSLWIDAAAIGPDYIPGHGHADNLTFVLALDGQKVIVDPAISTYEKNERRAWERATVAHNTVNKSGQSSSDVWAGFRVGRRAKTTITREKTHRIEAVHHGYDTAHRRSFNLISTGQLIIIDEFDSADAMAQFHFKPGIEVIVDGDQLNAGPLKIAFDGATKVDIDHYHCAEGFNLLEKGFVVQVAFTKSLRSVLSW